MQLTCWCFFCGSIHQAVKDGTQIVDVDGSYMYKKCKKLEDSGQTVAPLDPPSAPICGWEPATETNATEVGKKIPCVTSGTVYTYLANHVHKNGGEGTFRALMQGYTHWASGRID